MSDADDWIYVVDIEVDAEVEDGWNDWYDREHLPEILTCPGFLRGRRYVTGSGASRRYITVYVVTGPEVLSSDEFLERRGWGPYGDNLHFRTGVFKAVDVAQNSVSA